MATLNTLEDKIMDCWIITNDIAVILKATETRDRNEIQNMLIGLESLYNVKFELLFKQFEKVLAYEAEQRRISRKNEGITSTRNSGSE
jgi:hypothetical protein